MVKNHLRAAFRVRRYALVALVVVLAVAAAPAMAGKRGASITANGVNPHAAMGQQVYFTATAPGIDHPWVNTKCYQDGEVVYSQWHGAWDGYAFDPVFTIGPTPSWQSGDADCVARVGVRNKSGKFRTLASMKFTAVDY